MKLSWRFYFVAPMVVGLAMVVLFPTIYLFKLSLTHWVITDPDKYFAGLDNFAYLFGGSDFWQATRVTIAYLVISTVLMLILAMGMALALARTRMAGLMRSIVVMPLIIPPVVAGFTWKFLLNGEIGFFGAFLFPFMGFEGNMLADPLNALLSVVIADVWSRTPFMFLIFLAALQSIPDELYEAALLDGANAIKKFFFLTLPMIRDAVFVALLFRVFDALNTFELIYVMTTGGPGRATQTLSILGWRTAFQSLDLGQSAAIGVVMLFTTMICAMMLFKRHIRKSI